MYDDNAPIPISTSAVRSNRVDRSPAPSDLPGANIRCGGGVSGVWWYCDGTQIYSVGPESAPPESHRYKTYSLYFDKGTGFWAINCDAVAPIADCTGWQPLQFEHDPDDGYSSYLTNVATSNTLACHRQDQAWPAMLLPTRYHGIETPYGQYGALKGELAIFLALLAFSLKPQEMPMLIPQLFQSGTWCVHSRSHGRMYLQNQCLHILTLCSRIKRSRRGRLRLQMSLQLAWRRFNCR